MANKYEAHAHDGKVHHVSTHHHHDDHSESDFKKLLAVAVQGAASGAAGRATELVITRFIFKGKH